ncbi:MAG: RNA-binding S4 domain-containing protein [Bacilli bacterium]|nr:RNA-binding S4 domain-containing protein [Bacilli bacterium]
MRLDLFLKETRLIKRRTIAKELCDVGKVFINDKASKPSADVKEGDIITLKVGLKEISGVAHIEIRGTREFPSIEQLGDNDA